MEEEVKNVLEALIQEQRERICRLRKSSSTYKPYYYGAKDEEEYSKWLIKSYRFLRTYFENDEYVKVFNNVSKSFMTLEQQQKLLFILQAFLEYPNIIENKVVEMEKQTSEGNKIIINNTNTQSQQQSQQQSIEILIKALEDQLSVSQLKEIKQVVEEAKGDLVKAKPKLIDKIKSFGENVTSNILANIITNPAIWALLG